ncbi:MAG TPA: nucleotide-binding protein [Methanoculleus sp.]|nr:nucleotide-binding protein [Methanoculleus sp.]
MTDTPRRRLVLDASAFFVHITAEGELYTTHSVVAELRDVTSQGRLELLRAQGLIVLTPASALLAEVQKAAVKSGDATVLSAADTDVLALALETGSAVMTDDYAVQNTAMRLGVEVVPIQMRAAKKRKWKYRCSGCGRYWSHPGECEVCGAEIRRKF